MDPRIHKALQLIIGGVAALGGLVAILGYYETKRDRELKSEILSIDKHIKLLDLDNKLHKATKLKA